jgi:uncharacterized tellurite resistance protein B-like protein
MFADLIKRLTAPQSAPMAALDSRLALAALLVRIAKSDGNYAATEIARIDRTLMRRYGLDPVVAAKVRAEAEDIEHEAPDTVRFTRAIKDAVPYEDRASVVEALWDVALSDGARDADEDAILRLVAPMLGVTDQDSAHARRRVEARLKTP